MGYSQMYYMCFENRLQVFEQSSLTSEITMNMQIIFGFVSITTHHNLPTYAIYLSINEASTVFQNHLVGQCYCKFRHRNSQ